MFGLFSGSTSPSHSRAEFESFLPIGFIDPIPSDYPCKRNQEVFKGILITGSSGNRRWMKRMISKYRDRPVIGDVIKNRLRYIDFQDQPVNHGKSVGGWANISGSRMALKASGDADWSEWVLGHELGHILGFGNNADGERGCDAFADFYIFKRPQYHYTEEQLSKLAPLGTFSISRG